MLLVDREASVESLRFRIITGSWWFTMLVTIFLALSVRSAVADWNDVPTGSMKPTIVEGDRIFVNKLAYDLKVPFTTVHAARWRDPGRGDIVVFRSPADGKRLVKRVVGLPGDVVFMDHNRLSINGVPVTYGNAELPAEPEPGALYFYEYLPGHGHRVQFLPSSSLLSSFRTLTVPEGSYLMLGDNRDNSGDSRVFGFVPRRNILGRATAVAMSFDRNKRYQPRWERFFSSLE